MVKTPKRKQRNNHKHKRRLATTCDS